MLMIDVYKELKKRHGEKFAQTVRNHHNGILGIPNILNILLHAGQEAKPLLPYLTSLLLMSNDDTQVTTTPGDPFALLEQAGYKAFHADTLKKQNSIAHHFKEDELLCTFYDAARYRDYYIVHAIKQDVDTINREDFNGIEERQDAYGTSVISIQMKDDFIKVTNRYNYTVLSSEHTFDSNPNNIISGLSPALKNHFNVDFSPPQPTPPKGSTVIDDQVFKYHQKSNNIYYGDQAWIENDQIHEVNESDGYALFDGFLFDNKTKTLKKIDPSSEDSFAEDFNRYYGGNPALTIQKGNLLLNGKTLIGAEKSRIKTLHLPAFTTMSDKCLECADALTHFVAPALTTMSYHCLRYASALTHFEAPELTTMGEFCLHNTHTLTHFEIPKLTTMGDSCLYNAHTLTHFEAPVLTTIGDKCLYNADALTHFEAPMLQHIPYYLERFAPYNNDVNSLMILAI